MYGPFLEAAATPPVVATPVFDEGDGAAQPSGWADALRRTAGCEPVPLPARWGPRLGPEEGAPATTGAR